MLRALALHSHAVLLSGILSAIMRPGGARRAVFLLLVAMVLIVPHDLPGWSPVASPILPRRLFIMYSAIAPREAPALFRRYFRRSDYARVDSVSPSFRIPRRHRYALPTTLRRRWAGEPGVRYWTGQGCGSGTPGTIVYDPERRDWTPPREQTHFAESVHRAAQLVGSTGCHAFGLAPGSTYLGIDARSCSYSPKGSFYTDVRWKSVDLLDIQAQRLLGDYCIAKRGLNQFSSVVTSVGAFVQRQNPAISVVAQVSFRDNPPSRMLHAIASVAETVDGVYFSYPTTNPEIPCEYCSPVHLERFLQSFAGNPSPSTTLRGGGMFFAVSSRLGRAYVGSGLPRDLSQLEEKTLIGRALSFPRLSRRS